MDSTSDLVEFWTKLECAKKPAGFLHPDDRERVLKDGVIHPQSSTEFYRDHWKPKGPDRRIIASLIPKPFVGRLEKSRIVIVLANPGFEPGDLSEIDDKHFRDAAWRNLWQMIPQGEFPFYFLNPEFAWHPGFRWWNRVLGSLIKSLEASRTSRLEVLRFLADNLSCIESFPYHSECFPGSWVLGLPSSTIAKAAVDHLIGQGDRLVHIMRPRDWARNRTSNCSVLVNSANQRNCALTADQVKVYLKFLQP